LVLDRIEESADRRLARHLVGMYLEDTPENASREEILVSLTQAPSHKDSQGRLCSNRRKRKLAFDPSKSLKCI